MSQTLEVTFELVQSFVHNSFDIFELLALLTDDGEPIDLIYMVPKADR